MSGSTRARAEHGVESTRAWIGLLTGAVLVCMTAALYAAGRAFREGYLYQLGFDASQIPADFHETLYWGFSGGTPLAAIWLLATLIAFLGFSVLLWIADGAWSWAKLGSQRLRRIAQSSDSPRHWAGTPVKLIAGAFVALPVLYLLVVAYIGLAEMHKLGTRRGKQLVAALETDAAAASAKHGLQWIEISLDSPPFERIERGYRLLCTEHLCSIYDPDLKVRSIRVISLENLRQIRVVGHRSV